MNQEEYIRWSQQYAAQTDQTQRQKMLEQALQQDTEHYAEHELRQKIWQCRYASPRVDAYIRFWMEVMYAQRTSRSFFGRRKLEKVLRQGAQLLFLDQYSRLDEAGKRIVEEELEQMVRLYSKLALKDVRYASQLCGMMRMQDDAVCRKLGKEFWQVSCILPAQVGLKQLYQPLAKAAQKVFAASFEGGLALYEEIGRQQHV